MAAIRHGWAGVRSIGSVGSLWGRRVAIFIVAALAMAPLAGCARDARKQGASEPQAKAAQDPQILARDSFDGKLGLAWEIVNPLESHWSLSKRPGTLTLTTAAGTFVRSRTDYKNLFLLDVPGDPNQDFQITTCLVSFEPNDLWNQAGLVLWNDENNFLTVVYEWGEGPPELGVPNQRMFTVGREMQGRPVFSWYYADRAAPRLWLRVTKRGNRFELSTSADGTAFTPLNPMRARGVVDHFVSWGNGVVRRVGLVAGNGSARDAAPVDASFDFVELKALPAAGE